MAKFKKYTGFEIYNNIGPICPGEPAQLFGPVPVVGAFFELRSPEVFNHFTRSVTLHLDWMYFPQGDLSRFVVELRSGGHILQAPLFSKLITIKFGAFDDSLRITLMAPEDPFGHLSYPARVADAVLHHLPFPEQPFVPVVKKIWMDYETS